MFAQVQPFFDMKTIYVGEVRFKIGYVEKLILYVVEAKYSAKEKVGMIKMIFSGWFRFGGGGKHYIFEKEKFEEKLDNCRTIFLEGVGRNVVIERAIALKERMQDEICEFVEEVRGGEMEAADAVIEEMRSEAADIVIEEMRSEIEALVWPLGPTRNEIEG